MVPQTTVSADGPITLHFRNITRIAGETITGRVDLNVAQAQEDNLEHLRIIFKGTMNCKVTELESTHNRRGHTSNAHHETILLFYKKIRLWDRGTTFPAPGSHILPCDFEFLLPENLPASFHCETHHQRATISYGIEIIGQRTGFHRTNRRIRRLFSVIPAASLSQLDQNSLRHGWHGRWKDFTQEEKLRHGIWGDYSHARAKLTLPDMDSYPILADIPFSFHVETDTKLMHESDGPAIKHGKPIFPAPPALSSDVKLVLHRKTQICVRSHTGHTEDDFVLKGSLGDITRVTAVQHVCDEPEWIPTDKKGKGIWRRAVHFHSTVAIPYAPTPSPTRWPDNVDWQYTLVLIVPFPGIGNDLRLEVPIQLHPGAPPPPARTSGSPGMIDSAVLPAAPPAYADVAPAGPLMLDLPPSYWSAAAEHHGWDEDEKV
ncbi:hypothetical protein C8R45DRAFT_983269 [Mycena sanguinolenta]|nr:hypothetical protein C8R45DRAFT_983269 [Mycena sanguinolenta]